MAIMAGSWVPDGIGQIAAGLQGVPSYPQPVLFGIAHIDLYFFYDIDIAILVVEISGENMPLRQALDVLYRFGRAYPTHWEPNGRGGHCAERVEWLSHSGKVLAVSDYENRERYLRFVCERRVPCVASHWEYLMRPLVLFHSDEEGAIRYREIEYQRMPLMSYLAFDDNDPADACGSGASGPGDPAGRLADAAVFRALSAGL